MVQSASSYGPRRFELVSDVTCLVMRREIRILGNSSQQLWGKGSNQSAYKPSDLHITHVCFYSVHPKLAHTDHLGLELYTYKTRPLPLYPRVPRSRRRLRSMSSRQPWGRTSFAVRPRRCASSSWAKIERGAVKASWLKPQRVAHPPVEASRPKLMGKLRCVSSLNSGSRTNDPSQGSARTTT